uniref:Uncharacterized protein n=1 Tax=Anguilla anguilla TaxID=7936 RepID=A0A0E9RNU1_ANGAN
MHAKTMTQRGRDDFSGCQDFTSKIFTKF